MKMNKTDFLISLKEKTGLSEEDCLKVNDVVDETFIIGKKNKEKMINAFKEKLNIDAAKANEIYEVTMSIISSAIKNKIRHPFK